MEVHSCSDHKNLPVRDPNLVLIEQNDRPMTSFCGSQLHQSIFVINVLLDNSHSSTTT